MRFRRRRSPTEPAKVHRGRIWRDADSGFWRYACEACDYGAGSSGAHAAEVAHPWLIRLASSHALKPVRP